VRREARVFGARAFGKGGKLEPRNRGTISLSYFQKRQACAVFLPHFREQKMPAKLKPHFLHLAFALFLFSVFHSLNVIGGIIAWYG
jgi:hypothetical protein